MSTINFIPGTVITADWLNAVDRNLYEDLVHVKNYVVGDGITDDTTAIRAVHTLANASGARVTYRGVTNIAIDADAQINIRTSVDFAGVTFTLLNGEVVTPSFSAFNTLFIVDDPACPLTTASDPLTDASQLSKGSRTPTAGAFDGPGYAYLTCTGFTIPDRAKTGTESYTQAFKVTRNGESQHPIAVDLSSHDATTTIQYRANSDKPIYLNNAVFPATGWNNQILFKIQRNEVTLSNIYVPQDSDTSPYTSVDSLVYVDSVSDFKLIDYVGPARNYDVSSASYNLNINSAANMHVVRMQGVNGWGAIGSNNVNGLYFHDCMLNRVDVHGGGFNVFVDNCDISDIGVVYGWGGGVWKITNSRFYDTWVLTVRDDWGGTFFGDIIIDGITASHDGTQTYIIADFSMMGATEEVYAPNTITIQNVTRVGTPQTPGSPAAIDAIRLTAETPASMVIYAPDEINIRNISSFPEWRFSAKIDILNMERHPESQGFLRINLDNISADTFASSSTGVAEYTSARTPTNAVIPSVKATNVKNLYVNFTPDVNYEVIAHSCDVNGINSNVANTNQPYVELRDCRLKTPVSGLSPAPVGGTTSSTTGHTIMSNCKIESSSFTLAYIASSIGTLVKSGVSPTLPGGVAIADLFTGWVKSSTFA